ncbi:MAG TPA: hypothetical protein DIS79_08040 [Bacteroidetes bacterium]|nr:hypothetical protein [Bacteroidota bacterium]HRK05847.1 hypothetical protein [Chlorobiota bacterium]
MKILLAFSVALALVLTACSTSSTEPATSSDPSSESSISGANVRKFPYKTRVYNECAQEFVDFEGEIQLVSNSTAVKNGDIHRLFKINIAASGVGRVTGEDYNLKENYSDNLTYDVNTRTFEGETTQRRIRVISKGSSDNFYVKFKYHITLNNDGEEVVEFRDNTSECGG